MKKILIFALVAILGLSVSSCRSCTSTVTEEEKVETVADSLAVVDTTAVDVAADTVAAE